MNGFIDYYKKLIFLMGNNRINVFFLLLAFNIFIVLLETISLGTFLPLLITIVKMDIIMQYEFLEKIYISIGTPNQKTLFLYSLFFILIVYSFKTIFLVIYKILIIKESKKLNYNITVSLLKKYYSLDIVNLKKFNSSLILRNLTRDVDIVGLNSISSIILIVSEVFFITLLLIIFLIVNLQVTIVLAIIIFMLIYFYNQFVSKKVTINSKNIQTNRLFELKLIKELFENIKVIKILNKYDDQSENFLKFFNKQISSKFSTELLKSFPRLTFEFIAILLCNIVVLIYMHQGYSVEEVFIFLGLFAAIALKLFPSSIKITDSIQTLRHIKPSLDTLFNENIRTDNINNSRKEIISKKFVIIDKFKSLGIKKLNFRYNINNNLLDNIDLKINIGDNIGIQGESGSGKSTLVDLICGFILPTSGKLMINNIDINLVSLREWRKMIGYVSQDSYLFDGSIAQNIAFTYKDENIDKSKLIKAIELSQIGNYVNSTKNGLETQIGEKGAIISSGQKQRIAIARALYHGPELLILDEATSNLDLETENNFYNSIKQALSKLTCIIISHRDSSLKICQKIYKIENKKITEKINRDF